MSPEITALRKVQKCVLATGITVQTDEINDFVEGCFDCFLSGGLAESV
jgi:hypothetical protein